MVYAVDTYEPYAIHKTTMLSFDPHASCLAIVQLFRDDVTPPQTPPDVALAPHARWVRFTRGGKGELHFFHTPVGMPALRRLATREDRIDPLRSPYFDNHAGIYVPSLTEVVIRCRDAALPHVLFRRADGLFQLYVHLPHCLDYLEFDSVTYDPHIAGLAARTFDAHTLRDRVPINESSSLRHSTLRDALFAATVVAILVGGCARWCLRCRSSLTLSGVAFASTLLVDLTRNEVRL